MLLKCDRERWSHDRKQEVRTSRLQLPARARQEILRSVLSGRPRHTGTQLQLRSLWMLDNGCSIGGLRPSTGTASTLSAADIVTSATSAR
jgi:hypothetical protein